MKIAFFIQIKFPEVTHSHSTTDQPYAANFAPPPQCSEQIDTTDRHLGSYKPPFSQIQTSTPVLIDSYESQMLFCFFCSVSTCFLLAWILPFPKMPLHVRLDGTVIDISASYLTSVFQSRLESRLNPYFKLLFI
jgi:hypothetical protein